MENGQIRTSTLERTTNAACPPATAGLCHRRRDHQFATGGELGGRQARMTNDPATGVIRHADAGYVDAVARARDLGLDRPMIQG